MRLSDALVLVRGGGDLATGVAHRLQRAGLTVAITELPQPLAVRRAVAFAEAVYSKTITVEGVTARFAADPMVGIAYTALNEIPVMLDQAGEALRQLRPAVVVDARIAKRNLDTHRTDAPLVIGLGPGFVAGEDCHVVVETNRGHHLGRVYWQGSAEPDTGQPEPVQGFVGQRVLRAPSTGLFYGQKQIGDHVRVGEVLALVNQHPLLAPFDGVLRGLLHDDVPVTTDLKVGDLDPRGRRENCFLISDKARAIGGGVLEAILTGSQLWSDTPLAVGA